MHVPPRSPKGRMFVSVHALTLARSHGCNSRPHAASMMHEMACSDTDCEGLLFGSQQSVRRVAVGDAHESTATDVTTLTIESFLPMGGPLRLAVPACQAQRCAVHGMTFALVRILSHWPCRLPPCFSCSHAHTHSHTHTHTHTHTHHSLTHTHTHTCFTCL
jgi:hypothetical protein